MNKVFIKQNLKHGKKTFRIVINNINPPKDLVFYEFFKIIAIKNTNRLVFSDIIHKKTYMRLKITYVQNSFKWLLLGNF